MRHPLACTFAVTLAVACARTEESAPASGSASSAITPDSAAASAAALDTLRRLGSADYVVDSLVRRGDTAVVWTGPRVWQATDRPTSVVSVVAPTRVVGIRHIPGG